MLLKKILLKNYIEKAEKIREEYLEVNKKTGVKQT